MIGATVVGKPAETVITSSEGSNRLFLLILEEVKALIATKFALGPELTRRHFLAPR